MYKIKDLIEYFPHAYRNEYLTEVLRCCQIEIEKYFSDLTAAEDEYFVSTATYTLPWWSELVGVDFNTENDIDTARSNVIAKMKSNGTTTVDVIKAVAESYSNGTCEVIELYDQYKFIVKFTSTLGVPVRIAEIKKIIEKIKPAHLDFEFEYTYRTWSDLLLLNNPWTRYKDNHITWEDIRERGVI